jgi:hypothetical protein
LVVVDGADRPDLRPPNAPDEVHVEMVYEAAGSVSIGRKFVVGAVAIVVTSVLLLLGIIEWGGGNPAPRPLPRPSSISAIGALKPDREVGPAVPDKGDDQ